MQPLPVVKHLDILECHGRRAPAPALHSLVLEIVEPALSRRISQQFPLRLIFPLPKLASQYVILGEEILGHGQYRKPLTRRA